MVAEGTLNSMKCLVIGYGSIGSRHARLLSALGHETSVVSSKDVPDHRCFKSVGQALQSDDFQYAVIANPTSVHLQTLNELVQRSFKGLILVEKPLFDQPHEPPETTTGKTFVAYNLRFHPALIKAREMLEGRDLYSLQAYVGQYLPTWRPEADYRQCYSSSRMLGGGALRDLSHDLDYVSLICGGWKSVAAMGGKVSDLEIDSDDLFCLLLRTENCPAAMIQVNYLDLRARRELLVNAQGLSLRIDFMAGTLETDGEIFEFQPERDQTYIDQHRAILAGKAHLACSLRQGREVLELIRAAEQAAAEKTWVDK